MRQTGDKLTGRKKCSSRRQLGPSVRTAHSSTWTTLFIRVLTILDNGFYHSGEKATFSNKTILVNGKQAHHLHDYVDPCRINVLQKSFNDRKNEMIFILTYPSIILCYTIH